MKKNNILAAILITFLLQSCTKMFLSHYGIFDERAEINKISNNVKQLAFIQMHHVGKPNFYEGVKCKIDSLQKAGYFVFYEAVANGVDKNSAIFDTVIRKFRKVTGLTVPQGTAGYLDSDKGTLNGKQYSFLKGLVNQPKGTSIGIDSNKSKRVDMDFVSLINKFEKKYGTIILDDCDWSNALNTPYLCVKNYPKAAIIDMLENFRNENLVNEIINSSYTKILVVYGARHYKKVVQMLNTKDKAWQ